MNSPEPSVATIHQQLDQVRARLRSALTGELLARLVVALGGFFLVWLLVDWLMEPSPSVRLVAYAAMGIATVGWLVRTTLLPLLMPLTNQRLALWIEQRRPEFRESLVTAVEAARESSPAESPLLRETTARAMALVDQQPLDSIVRFDRFYRWAITAGFTLLAIVGLAIASTETFGFYLKRLALSQESWPRQVALLVEGFEREASGLLVRRVAYGDAVDLSVAADLTDGHIKPAEVAIRFGTPGAKTERDVLSEIGAVTTGAEAKQAYRYSLERVTEELEINLQGGDARLGPLRLMVERRPSVVAIELEVTPPSYLNQSPYRIPSSAAGELPEGSQVGLIGRASKPLSAVGVTEFGSSRKVSEATEGDGNGAQAAAETNPLATKLSDDGLRFEIAGIELTQATSGSANGAFNGSLSQAKTFAITLRDQYEIESAEPHPLTLRIATDRVPMITLTTRGIGPTVTPDARLVNALQTEDDHALNQVQVTLTPEKTSPAAVQPKPITQLMAIRDNNPQLLTAKPVFDLLELRSAATDSPWQVEPGDRLTITASASDRFDLSDSNRTTNSPPIELTVVTPEQLVARLEQQEVNLRETFESSVEEIRKTALSLEKLPPADEASKSTPAEEGEPDANEPIDLVRLKQLRLSDNVAKVAQETLAVAEAFEELYLELENNRIKNEELKDRLQVLIAKPLRAIGEQSLPALRTAIRDQANSVERAAIQVDPATRSQTVVKQMEEVLAQMRALETYNEVVAMLREIIDEQQSLQEQTEKTRRDSVRKLLLD